MGREQVDEHLARMGAPLARALAILTSATHAARSRLPAPLALGGAGGAGGGGGPEDDLDEDLDEDDLAFVEEDDDLDEGDDLDGEG